MIGVVIAMPSEAFALYGRKGWRSIKAKQSTFQLHQSNTEYLVLQSGLGLARAEEAALWLVDQGVHALVSLGISGGLIAGLATGDLILADALILATQELKSDAAWMRQGSVVLQKQGLILHSGRLVSVVDAVLSPNDKVDLAKETGAIAVDMESAAVAHVAELTGLPYLALRSICDTVSQEVGLDPARILTKEGRVHAIRLIAEIARKPSLLLALPRLGKDFNVALNALQRGWRVLEGELLATNLI